ncbi:MAG TPA: hypothetical protein VNX46_00440, partial [Candidatus Acidoferrum sp.]|nr:hypothetical protein [Candidatus Acidoferrum sp.]
MNQPLETFKQEYQTLLLNFLWRQWSALGVAGQAGGEDVWVIDPEALLLLTCTLGRHEPRLFDEVLDWLRKNGRFINVMRLKRVLQTEKFAGERVLSAVAGVLAKGTEATKWKMLANSVDPSAVQEIFFLTHDGKSQPVPGEPEPHFARCGYQRGPLRLRGYSQKFRPSQPANLALQLRALFGVNVRCESVL